MRVENGFRAVFLMLFVAFSIKVRGLSIFTGLPETTT